MTYSVPLLSEVRKGIGSNGFTAISTFSGCGGSCLGLEMAGYKILAASEFVEEARLTYNANHLGVPVSPLDIRELRGQDLLKLANVTEIDLLEGSPPCASFSVAGKRERGWGNVSEYSDTAQRSDDLFFEFARIIKDIQPKVFIAENVKGLVIGKAKGYFKEIIRRLRSAGYDVEAKVLDASYLGVPQARQRVIFVGVRKDLGLPPVFPTPFSYRYSIREAISDLLKADEGSLIDKETGERISFEEYKIGKEWLKTPMGGHSKYLNILIRPDLDAPCPTITATGGQVGAASVTHPLLPRKFNLEELRRLCSFPDDFVLTGTYKQRYERLGRSVPPLMMKAVGDTVRDEILRKIK